ncbi:hypothetical protein [Pseudorhodobacter sp.]|nr:hypothetical protein [Pseudorhodobacter sp.]
MARLAHAGALPLADGQTLRQAAVAEGFDPDADRLLVGIPAEAFAE